MKQEKATQGAPLRGTQSFVYVMAEIWRRPSLTALEVLWRWVAGVPILWLVASRGRQVWLAATGGTGDAAQVHLAHFTLMDPMVAAMRLAEASSVLLPLVLHTACWLVPLVLAFWVVVSTFGRMAVLRRLDPALKPKASVLMLLGAIRVAAVTAAIILWLAVLIWCGRTAVVAPMTAGAEPNLVLYFALIITATLLFFVAWAAVSWVVSIAPLLSVLHGLVATASLRAALRLGALRGKLIEINLVMGIVKIALLVLAMVFSATPLPFQTYTTDGFLWSWWAGVALFYLLTSDLFHVVRVAACLALSRSMAEN